MLVDLSESKFNIVNKLFFLIVKVRIDLPWLICHRTAEKKQQSIETWAPPDVRNLTYKFYVDSIMAPRYSFLHKLLLERQREAGAAWVWVSDLPLECEGNC